MTPIKTRNGPWMALIDLVDDIEQRTKSPIERWAYLRGYLASKTVKLDYERAAYRKRCTTQKGTTT